MATSDELMHILLSEFQSGPTLAEWADQNGLRGDSMVAERLAFLNSIQESWLAAAFSSQPELQHWATANDVSGNSIVIKRLGDLNMANITGTDCHASGDSPHDCRRRRCQVKCRKCNAVCKSWANFRYLQILRRGQYCIISCIYLQKQLLWVLNTFSGVKSTIFASKMKWSRSVLSQNGNTSVKYKYVS